MENEKFSELKIGLALSGGGARAIAFHLGCLRALNNRGLLDKVTAMSTVSGGSLIGALYAYSNKPFDEFEEEIKNILTKGLTGGISRYTLFSKQTLKIIWCIVITGIWALICDLFNLIISGAKFLIPNQFRKFFDKISLRPTIRFSSRTTAFEQYLEEKFFQGKVLSSPTRNNLVVNINAAELRTQTVFNFGSDKSNTWRFGELKNPVLVSHAVTASAAFPVFLPAIDEELEFKKTPPNVNSKQRVILTDGGVYDNVGTDYFIRRLGTENQNSVNFIIACVADQGLPDGLTLPYTWFTRMIAMIETTHRRTETMTFNLLHRLYRNGGIKGFMMPYLGKQDDTFKQPITDLILREKVYNYPTDFKAMPQIDIDNISKRGEQLTNYQIDTYYPNL